MSLPRLQEENGRGRSMSDKSYLFTSAEHEEAGGNGREGEEEINDSPIEQVRLTVPPTDNPNLPVLTFRTWILGFLSCVVLAFVGTFFGYRENPLRVGWVPAQIVTLPLGRLMAASLPAKTIRVPLTGWFFSLNPGPFNIKEHVLITTFAGCGANPVYGLFMFSTIKVFYRRVLNPWAAFLFAQTTMLLGYGWVGMLMKILVDSPHMWWPVNLIQVSLFRTLHEEEKRSKGEVTRLQFFLIALVVSFAYYIVPGFFVPSLSGISVVCLIWKNSVLAQQIGSGLAGLGVGSFAFDWNTVVSFLGNPIAAPPFAILNTLAGFVFIVYIITPLAYWRNAYEAQRFPLYSVQTFDSTGNHYNISRVLNQRTFSLDKRGYEEYSKLYLSISYAINYGVSFATLSATLSHVALGYWGTSLSKLKSQATTTLRGQFEDVHVRLMKRNYKEVPQWWFYALFIVVFGLALVCCEGFDKEIQLPWWGLMLAAAMALFFTLPVGIIQSTTNQQPGLNVITQLVIGLIYPGRPLASAGFKVYGYISMTQAYSFISVFNLGHYMKIPPRSMFLVLLVGTIISSTVQFGTSWWLLQSIEHICDPALLPKGSLWTCPVDRVFYNDSVIWGAIGTERILGKDGTYFGLNWFFLVGALAPVPIWFLSHKYPEKRWIQLINVPLFLGATSGLPPARTVNYITWFAVAIYVNIHLFHKSKAWWANRAYTLGAALSSGIAFMGILLYFSLQSKGISLAWWVQNTEDHCPLATCPTAPTTQIPGCPSALN